MKIFSGKRTVGREKWIETYGASWAKLTRDGGLALSSIRMILRLALQALRRRESLSGLGYGRPRKTLGESNEMARALLRFRSRAGATPSIPQILGTRPSRGALCCRVDSQVRPRSGRAAAVLADDPSVGVSAEADKLKARFYPRFPEDITDVGLNRRQRNLQLVGDLLSRGAAQDHLAEFGLAPRETQGLCDLREWSRTGGCDLALGGREHRIRTYPEGGLERDVANGAIDGGAAHHTIEIHNRALGHDHAAGGGRHLDAVEGLKRLLAGPLPILG